MQPLFPPVDVTPFGDTVFVESLMPSLGVSDAVTTNVGTFGVGRPAPEAQDAAARRDTG